MLRNIAGVIIGWVVMGIVSFLLFTGLYLVLGPDRSYQPNTWMVTNAWVIAHLVVVVLGSFVGGVVCAKIAKSNGAGVALAVIVLVVSLLTTLPHLTGDNTPKPRQGTPNIQEAMANSQMPKWMYVVAPLLSAAVIMFGSRRTLAAPGAQAKPGHE